MQNTNIIDEIVIEPPSSTNMTSANMPKGSVDTPIFLSTSEGKTLSPQAQIDFDTLTDLAQHSMKYSALNKFFSPHIKKHKIKEPTADGKTTVTGKSDDATAIGNIFTGDEEFMMMQQNNEKDSTMEVLEAAARTPSGSAIYGNKVKEFIEETNKEDAHGPVHPWHKLLGTPSKQMIVVDRMHSGARRQVTLDFGYPILLTDLIIPACSDLASLTIDVWCFEEDGDSIRLAVSQDIGIKALILSDLQPPPVCRYLKITFMGRYGMSATRCKLPMGSFYGHVVVLDKDSYADPVMKFVKNKNNYIRTQLKVLNALYEDTHCRYCLSSSKLSELLQPLLKSENSNMAHMQTYLNRMKDNDDQNQEFNKISTVYDECIAFQNQLNVVKNVIKRLEGALIVDTHQPTSETSLKSLCTDKLRVLSECLVESLLHFIITYGSQNVAALHNFFDLKMCNLMFKTLVINGDSHIRLATCSLLVRMCSYTFKPWWGDFFANTFTSLFSSQNVEIFPQDR